MSNKKDRLIISVESGTMIRAVAIVIGALLLLSFLSTILTALKLIFIAFFLALALNPAVSWISKILKLGNRVAATGLAYILVLTFLVAFFSVVIPPLVRQTNDFVKTVPQTIQNFQDSDTAVSRFVYKYEIDQEIEGLASKLEDRLTNTLNKSVLSTAGAVGSVVASTITVLVLTFMMLVEGPTWINRYLAMQAKKKREHHKDLLLRMYRAVTNYVNGQVVIAFIAGTAALVALTVFSSIYHVTINQIALAGIVTLFALMPLIGTTIGSVIAVIACLFVSLPLALTMAIFFVIYQQIENVTIQPYIQSKSSNLTALIVFSAALVGVTFAGIMGAFVAIPTAACIKILLEERYRERLEKAENTT